MSLINSNKIKLDNPKTYQTFDPSKMEQRIQNLPNQCIKAWDNSMALVLPRAYKKINNIVVVGMGGSAIGGSLVSDIASLENGLPILTAREYTVPRWVNKKTLVIVSSHSGNTEETVSAFYSAINAKAKIIVMTAGGTLKKVASDNNVPILYLPDNTEPRSSIGYSFIGLLGLLCSLGHLSVNQSDLKIAVTKMQEHISHLGSTIPYNQNKAKTLAVDLYQRMLIIYGAGILNGVARRWKTQVNENAKTWAVFEKLPEATHNSIEGYSFPSNINNKVSIILIKSSFIDPRILRKYDLLKEQLGNQGIHHIEIEAEGDNAISHMLSMILLGDYISYYLGLLNSINPSPTQVLQAMKDQLNKEKSE